MTVATAVDVPVPNDNLTHQEAQARAAMLSNLAYKVSLALSDDPDDVLKWRSPATNA